MHKVAKDSNLREDHYAKSEQQPDLLSSPVAITLSETVLYATVPMTCVVEKFMFRSFRLKISFFN